MSRHIIDNALRSFRTEIKDSVSSYFAPVRAVVKEVLRSVHEATGHETSAGRLFSRDGAPTKDRTTRH